MRSNYIVHLVGGQSVKCYAQVEDVDSIYDAFHDDKNIVLFDNAIFKVKHIAGLEYLEDDK